MGLLVAATGERVRHLAVEQERAAGGSPEVAVVAGRRHLHGRSADEADRLLASTSLACTLIRY
ncbi:hypothetical protein [Streptomyces sp. NPDC096033]|uniref:hypothetical protein n=1 Tax=Streptomyces sp. NPDC096033 TaxID=3366071 RepID=UPI003826AC66